MWLDWAWVLGETGCWEREGADWSDGGSFEGAEKRVQTTSFVAAWGDI